MERQDAMEGLRVVDMTHVLAGPGAVRFLADHGAQVIKVERVATGDVSRGVPPFPNWEVGINRSAYYNNINRGKHSVTLNLADPRGIDLLKRLVSVSDIVFENFSAGVMERLGLDYENLVKIKPDIIMIRMAGMGQTGPYAGYASYGPTLQALSGITDLTGFPDTGPLGYGYSYSDYTGGWAGCLAALHALHHRQKTGKGQCVDVAQVESLLPMVGVSLLDYAVNCRPAQRIGNRLPHSPAAPHGAYRCQGEDRWCVIAVFNEEEWRVFCNAIGNPSWTREERFSTVLARFQHRDELDRLVEGWTMTRTAEEVTEMLQKAGVAAGPVQEAYDLIERDPQMKHRGFFVEREHPEIGKILFEGVPFTLSDTPGKIRRAAPLLGEHNEFVYREILGIAEEEVNQYLVDSVI